jgi:uncharacterized sporulation protein YeaH/YhbH (DUF444 family)
MQIHILKSKIHRAVITEANLNYVGSLTVDEDLMDAANMIEYEKIHVEFVRHHTEADRVDEHTFFYDKLTGGTMVSSALELVNQIAKDEYHRDNYNLYVCQVTDGDNFDSDNAKCASLLSDQLLPKLQYMAYVEVVDKDGWDEYPMLQMASSNLFRTYEQTSTKHPNLQCVKISAVNEIYNVFRGLFEKK